MTIHVTLKDEEVIYKMSAEKGSSSRYSFNNFISYMFNRNDEVPNQVVGGKDRELSSKLSIIRSIVDKQSSHEKILAGIHYYYSITDQSLWTAERKLEV